MAFDRRAFIKLLSSSAVAASLPESIARALAVPANNATGTIADVEHIVFLMQENRSFDHYFGTLSGVRGFGDPRAVNLTTGNPVFYQPDNGGGHVLPFHPPAPNLGLQFLEDLPHDWNTTHEAWNGGNHDQWVPAKGYLTMAHLVRQDIPYHYALADAFTVCDAYHCSMLGPTHPNRYHMFSGWAGNDGTRGGPALDNSGNAYTWQTYPEVLEAAGISWKVYQDIGLGLNAAGSWGGAGDSYIGNYCDNVLLFFEQFRNAEPGSSLYQKARTGTSVSAGGTFFDQLRKDVLASNLPQVSWVVAPEAFTEHPNWPANYGAYYIAQILNALTANPAVWSKTVFFIMYDENDGFFDHAVPHTPPMNAAQGLSNVSTVNEILQGNNEFTGGPYGLGPRVPMLVISPWSKGGWVCSEVFDHTSLISFVQKRFGTSKARLADPNITPWRAAVSGDLTSALNFATPNNAIVALPSTTSYLPPDAQRHGSYIPPRPVNQALPAQEPGVRPARPVPYVLNVAATISIATARISLGFVNLGTRAAGFHVRSSSPLLPPRTYTLKAASNLSDIWNFATLGLTGYDLAVHGPNGFLRALKGSFSPTSSANVACSIVYNVAQGGVMLSILNSGKAAQTLQIVDSYTGNRVTSALAAGQVYQHSYSLTKNYGWYDFVVEVESDISFSQRLAGHLETGLPSMTDPIIGANVIATDQSVLGAC